MYLNYNNCYILLTEVESNFILDKFDKESSLNEIRSIIEEFYYNSSKRYFDYNHIIDISNNFYKKNVIKEHSAPGRNLRSSNSNNLAGDNSGINSASDILNFKDLVNAEVGVCTSSGSDIVTLFFPNNTTEIIYCDSPDEANIVIKNILYKNL